MLLRIKLLGIICLTLILVILPRPARAEIATGFDWMGLYPVISDADLIAYKATNISGYNWSQMQTFWLNNPLAWVYTSSCGGEGSQILTNPLLAGTCLSTAFNNLTPGLVGSLRGAFFYLFFPNNSLYNVDASQYFWRPFRMNANPVCNGPGLAAVGITWDSLQGVSSISIIRNGATIASGLSPSSTYNDIGVNPNTSYTYLVYAYSNADPTTNPCIANNPSETTPIDCAGVAYSVTTKSCQYPFLQTTGGDIHSNQNINAPGGPPASP